MRLIYDVNKTFLWCGDYDTRHLPKGAGFRWDPLGKVWFTNQYDRAQKLREYATPECRKALDAQAQAAADALALSRAADAPVEIPKPDGCEYLPFQKAGIVYASQRANCLIGDQMGLGKSVQAIGVVNFDPSIKSVLVVVPASLKLNWQKELTKWLVRPMSVKIANGKLPDVDVVVTNYDQLGKFHDALRARTWDLLILDEVHMLRNAKTIRSKEVFGGGRKDRPDEFVPPIPAKRLLGLTGTPIVNRPSELWNIVHHFDPQTWRSWKFFVERYCGAYQTKWGWETGGATNLPELQQKLRQTIMVRRLKADVLLELPPKRRKVIVLSADEYTGVIEREKQVTDRIDASLASVRAEVELAKAEDDAEYETAVARLQKAEMVAFTEMAQVRHDTAVAKVPAVIEQCKELLEETDRIVVFAHHHDVVDALMAGLAEFQPVKLTGTCSMVEKQQAVDTFQAQGECRVFVGSITAAGLGITLTAASTVVFAELDYVPGNVSQAEDRCHRIGQRDHVLVYHVVLDGSMDQKLAETLVEKQTVIDAALDKVGGTVKQEPIELPNQAATKSARKGQIEELAQKLTPADMLVIHSCLRQLAGMDQDHAHTQNNMGFNKVDTHIGHDLAERAYLTPKQSALGFLLCRKYKRQVEEIKEVLV
jgi:SWI/SNF-related matrix-associated actin-dependent regulator 1 of chromatin subfamily A